MGIYISNHAKLRFKERVKVTLPRNKKKFITNYIQKAYSNGYTYDQINNLELSNFLSIKQKKAYHNIKITKVTLYKKNVFLFHNKECITILELPEKFHYLIDNGLLFTSIEKEADRLKTSQADKDWLIKHCNGIVNTCDSRKENIFLVDIPKDATYTWIMENISISSIKYINNIKPLQDILKNKYKDTQNKVNDFYIEVMSYLTFMSTYELLKYNNLLIKNEQPYIIDYNGNPLSYKQIYLCYKQLLILSGGNIPKTKFNNDYIKDLFITNRSMSQLQKIEVIDSILQ